MFCRLVILCLLICATETVQVMEGRMLAGHALKYNSDLHTPRLAEIFEGACQILCKFPKKILRADRDFEEQNKVLEPSIIIIRYGIIIITAQYNYYISNKGHLKECKTNKMWQLLGCCCCFLFQKQTVNRSAQCHVLVQSPPHRRSNDKYPVNTSHRSDLCKNVSLQCYLVATVIHIQSLCSQMCVYIYTFFTL